MLKIITLIAICALSFAADVAEKKPTELAPAASKELKALSASLADNQHAKDSADLKAINSSKKALKKVVDVLLASKDLDSANAVNAEIKKLDAEVAKLTGMGDVDAKVLLAGKWSMIVGGNPPVIVVIGPDNNIKTGNISGTYEIKDTALTFKWSNGFSDKFVLPAVDGKILGISSGGPKITMEKL
jgi:hypothetical protein